MSPESTSFLSFSVLRLTRSAHDIDRCLDRLSADQLLHRGGEHENSIANLLMHLSGNMRQWVLHGIDGQPDVRVRDEEFALQPANTGKEIRKRFNTTVREICSVIAKLPEERLLEVIDPQPGSGWEAMPILQAVYQVVSHVQYHAGQIVLLTKQLTGADLNLTIPRRLP